MPICSATAPLVPEQQELLQTLAQHATVAVHLTRLAEQVRRRAVLEEPVAQARDMHSGLLQGLQAFKRTAPSFAEKLAEGSKSVCLPYLPRVGDRVGLRAPFPPARNFA